MNKKISAAVASAALVLGAASSANAGIIIPAGEWTLDVNGNVNVYATRTSTDDASTNSIIGGIAKTNEATTGEDVALGINTGLLPAWLGFTGTTRQNDLDVSFTISMQPNVSDNGVTGDSATNTQTSGPLWRQAFLTFGDASWGTVKMGKDIGIFARNAILSDMTLLGVGSSANGSGASTTLGGIGTGYIYAAWKGQVSYTTPNMNGLQATIGITNPNQLSATDVGLANRQDRYGVEGEVNYNFDAGKVWVSGASYKAQVSNTNEIDIHALDVGVNFNMGNAGLTAYVYTGEGAGTTFLGTNGFTGAKERDSDGGYIQGTYVIPTGTKIGLAYGVSKLDCATGETTCGSLIEENKRWTIGAYHPLTKHLNLVAEYNNMESDAQDGTTSVENDSISLGAILFF
jgi:predicted porin